MTFRSRQFAEPATDLIMNDFFQARARLVIIYLLIIVTVIVLFSVLVIAQVREEEQLRSIPPNSEIVLTEYEARTKAAQLYPGATIETLTYELEDRTLTLKFIFTDETEVEANLLTGEIKIADDEDEVESLTNVLIDGIDEKIIWIGLIVFLLASGLSIFVVNATLRPIVINAEKQKRFISDASHELRNPLAAILAALESFERAETKTVALSREVVGDLKQEVQRLIYLSESLLSFERSQQMNVPVKVSEVEAVVRLVEKRLSPLITDKHITIIRELDPAPLAMNPADLETILYNLLHNAIKFSPPRTSVTVSWSPATLSVVDRGIGISPERLPHIFERFYKADGARGFESLGSGLGLSLVQDITARYNATVSAESTVGSGTKISVTF